jgi:hypothetical protein
MNFLFAVIVGPILIGALVWWIFGQTAGLIVGGLVFVSALLQMVFARRESEDWIRRGG